MNLEHLAERAVDAVRRVDLYASLCEQDAKLVAKGFPAISPWWHEQLRGFYSSRKIRLVLRVGRRGGKSSTLCRIAVNEVLNGRHPIPPGDRGVFAFVSTKKDEARERLATVKEILDALGVDYEATADEVWPRGLPRPIVFRIYAANFRTSVGFTGVGLVFDEVARWRDDKLGANPATEVLRSMRPTISSQPQAHEFMSSSPWSTLDAHHEAMEQGDTDEQMTAHAPTWVAHPALTIARCKQLEPDDATRAREYGAEPMSALATSVFDFHAVDQAVARYRYVLPRRPTPGDTVTVGADFGFRRDSSALVVCHGAPDSYSVADLLELSPRTAGPLKPSETVSTFAAQLTNHGPVAVMADGHYRESITEHLVSHGLSYIQAPTDVPATYVRARALLHEGRIALPDHKQLIRDLKEVQSAPTATGRISIKLPKHEAGGHADLVSALVLACWQKGGYTVPAQPDLPKGWTREEMDDVARLERELRQERGDSWYSDEGDWISE